MATAQAVVSRFMRDSAADQLAALGAVRASWRRMGADFDASWQATGGQVVAAVTAAQVEAARLAESYMDAVFPQVAARAADPAYRVSAGGAAGWNGDGRPIAAAAYGGVIEAKVAVAEGATVAQALAQGERWLLTAMGTAIADTSREVQQMGVRSRGRVRYVRMVGPSACGRCIILAGRKYYTAAFERHPGCNCALIPESEDLPGDMRTNPRDFLDSLSDEQLAKALGSKVNAQAYRDGADLNQLINAYRKRGDVRTAQLYGRKTYSYTIEGVTRRGWGYQAMHQRHSAVRKQDDVRQLSGRYKGTQVQRLMPSSIYDIAKDRDDAIRLLKTYGWIL